MSKYTTSVRRICESYAERDEGCNYSNFEQLIASTRTKIFDFQYPIFDTEHKEELETKIIKHYFTREIGEETVGLWKLRLNTRMNEIMPYYNQLYESASLKYNPLEDVDITRVGVGSTKGHNDGASFQEGKTDSDSIGWSSATDKRTTGSTDKYSDTPDGGLEGVSGHAWSPDDLTYLTDVRVIDGRENGENKSVDGRKDNGKSESKNVSTSNNEAKSNNIEKLKGKQSSTSYSKLIEEYRQVMLNIDLMIVKDLNDLFMCVY